MVFVTTSKGLYAHDPCTGRNELVFSHTVTSRQGIWQRKGSGCFGICVHGPTGRLIVASREMLSFRLLRRYATDVRLHLVNPCTLEHRVIAEVDDVNDVHQIASVGDLVFLTDTGKNRVVVFDLARQRVVKILLVGPQRKDVNHINSIRLTAEEIVLVLNNQSNRTSRESQIMILPLQEVLSAKEEILDAQRFARLVRLPGKFDVHDIEPFDGTFLLSASKSGFVFRLDSGEKCIDAMKVEPDKWVRGIAFDKKGVWVGMSEFGSRAYRHNKSINGYLAHFSLEGGVAGELRKIKGCGQVNDLLWFDGGAA